MLLGAAYEGLRMTTETTERRNADRFPITRDLVYRILSGRTSSELGCGKTINISSNGVLFATQNPPSPGKRLELSISWPVQLEGKCGLQLVARGRVVRTKASLTAVEIERYEFRTRGSKGIGLPLLS